MNRLFAIFAEFYARSDYMTESSHVRAMNDYPNNPVFFSQCQMLLKVDALLLWRQDEDKAGVQQRQRGMNKPLIKYTDRCR